MLYRKTAKRTCVFVGLLFSFTTGANGARLDMQVDGGPASTTQMDYCDGWGSLGDCRIYISNSIPTSGAIGSVEINNLGLSMGGSSFGYGTGGGRASVRAKDSFTLNTVNGSSSALLDAAMNFTFDGEIFVPNIDRALIDVNLSVSITQVGGLDYLFHSTIRAEFGTSSGHTVDLGGHTADLLNMATITDNYFDPLYGSAGRLYRWNDELLSLPLNELVADLQTEVEFDLWVHVPGGSPGLPRLGGRADFLSTFHTYTSDPLTITSGPAEALYTVTTSMPSNPGPDFPENGASLFSVLELEGEQIRPPIPEPSTITLLIFFGIGMLARRNIIC